MHVKTVSGGKKLLIFEGYLTVLIVIFSSIFSVAIASVPIDCRVLLSSNSDPSNYRFEINKHGVQKRTYQDYAKLRYGNTGLKALQKLESLNSEYRVLVTDPGLVARIDEFVEFIKARELALIDPFAARTQFSNHLGKKTMYRALVLNEKEMIDIQQNGMKASGLINSKSQYLNDYPLLDMFWKRRSDNPLSGGDPMMSITSHPEIAVAVASKFLYRNSKPIFGFDLKFENKEIFLFEVLVPIIDILMPESNQDAVLRTRYLGLPLEVLNHTKKTKTQYSYDSDVESFLLYEIRPEEIVRVSNAKERLSVNF